MAIILLESSFSRRHSPSNVEILGNERREAFHQNPGNKRDEHEVDVLVKRANPWTKGLVVEPGRFFKTVEEIAQYPRRIAKTLIPIFYAGPDKPVQVGRRKRGEFPHNRVEHSVAHGGVSDIVVRGRMVEDAGLSIPFLVR